MAHIWEPSLPQGENCLENRLFYQDNLNLDEKQFTGSEKDWNHDRQPLQ